MPEISLVAELDGHSDKCWGVAWNPKVPLLATCSADKSVRLYSYRRQTPIHDAGDVKSSTSDYVFSYVTTLPVQHERTIRYIAWSPDGKFLATAGFDSKVEIWMKLSPEDREDEDDQGDNNGLDTEQESWDCIAALEGHESEVKCVAWNHDGTILATCGRDRSVWLWEFLPDYDFECLAVLMEHSQDVKFVAWHPKEEMIASSSYDDTIRFYVCEPAHDEWVPSHLLPPTQPASAKASGHKDTVWSMAFSASGNHLLSSSADATLKLWSKYDIPYNRDYDVSTGGFRVGKSEQERWDCAKTFGQDLFERPIYSVDWIFRSNTNGLVAAAGQDGKLVFWNTTESENDVDIKFMAEREDAHGVHDINCVQFCRISMSENKNAKEEYEDEEEEGNSESTERRLADAQGLLASAGDDGVVRVWKLT